MVPGMHAPRLEQLACLTITSLKRNNVASRDTNRNTSALNNIQCHPQQQHFKNINNNKAYRADHTQTT